MRFGVVGLGSMGKRRVRDLAAMGHGVIGFDIRADRNAEAEQRFGVRTVDSFERLAAERPDAIVISTPPDVHLEYYRRAFAARLPFFSEANTLTPSAAWFAEREAAAGVRSFPSATLHHYPLFPLLCTQLEAIGRDRVTTVHAHYGGYLPSWHPWEPYDAYYAGRHRRACAAREMVPFELEWLHLVFGRVASVSAVQDRRGEWRTDIDDTYLVLLDFESGVRGTLLVELHQCAPFRLGRVGCREHSFTVDMIGHELRRYELATDSWRILKPPGMRVMGSFAYEDIYAAEMRAFVEALAGRAAYPKSWAVDRHLSDVLFAAEESWRRRAWVDVADVADAYDGCSWVED